MDSVRVFPRFLLVIKDVDILRTGKSVFSRWFLNDYVYWLGTTFAGSKRKIEWVLTFYFVGKKEVEFQF